MPTTPRPDQLRELLAEGTPGPWFVADEPPDGPYEGVKYGEGDAWVVGGALKNTTSDAALIVAAVNALPSLLDELARLQRIEEAARELLVVAEEEVAEKDNTPEKQRGGAEYWASQEVGLSVPGVDRRIRLAKAVLVAHAALSPEEEKP